MAQRRKQPKRSARRGAPRQNVTATRKKTYFNPEKPEFKADSIGNGLLNKLYMTRHQRHVFARWGFYALTLILLLVLQDVIMSRTPIFGITTDLVACGILLITVMEGIDNGSVFVLIASALYYFSGSSPGPYSVVMLCVFGIGAAMFRQAFWHRSRVSIVFCAGIAQLLFEVGTCFMGIFQHLTYWGRLPYFVATALLSSLCMFPLYSLIDKIGQIGGRPWKE